MITEKDMLDIVEREVKRHKYSKTDLAKMLQVHPASVSGFFIRGSIRLNRLVQFSKILNYNVFQEIANRLEIPHPEPANNGEEEIKRLKEEVESYKKQVHDLEIQVATMEKTYSGFMKGIFNK